MKSTQILLVLAICLFHLGLGWFYSHPEFIYDKFQSRMWHLWDKSCMALLFASAVYCRRVNRLILPALAATVIFCIVRVIWQIFEFENEVRANQPKVIFILYILNIFVIAWIMHIRYIVNALNKWQKAKYYFFYRKH